MRNGLSSEERELLSSPQEVGTPAEAKKLSNATSNTPDEDERSTLELSELHRAFAESLGQRLTECLGRESTVCLRDAGLSTYSQFVFGQPVPCCSAIVSSEATPFEFCLAVSPSVHYPMLDQLLGARESEPLPQRPMTEIERGLIEVLLAQMIATYEDTWRPVLSLGLKLVRLEHNVQQSRWMSGSETTYRAKYELRFDSFSGMVEFCLPWEALSRLSPRERT